MALARTRAPRRLIGAGLLLALGVVVFPLVFDTQPRPAPQDGLLLPTQRDRAAVAVELAARASEPAAVTAAPAASVASAAASSPTAPAPVVAESTVTAVERAELPPAAAPAAPLTKPAAAAASAKPTAPAAAPRPAVAAASSTRAAPETVTAAPTAAAAPAEDAPRYVVQVGAYTDADTLREARQRVEKLGLKTYTQVIEHEGKRRTRVRVGPFTDRAQAETVSAKLKAAGLPGAILTL